MFITYNFLLSNVIVTNYFNYNIFYKFVDISNFLLVFNFSYRPTININFSFTNNYSPYQQFVNSFCKKVCISSITLSCLDKI